MTEEDKKTALVESLRRDFDRRRATPGEHYRHLFELASDAMLLARPPDGLIVECNTAAANLLGYEKAELTGLRGSDVIATEWQSETERTWEEQFAQRGEFLLETWWVRKDGLHIPVAVSGKPVDFGGQRLIFLVGRDISTRRLAEAQLEELSKKLAQAHRMETIGMLAGAIAHDFKNVLQAIRLNVEVCLDQADGDAPITGRLEQMAVATERATELVSRVLTFARSDVPGDEVVNVHNLVRETVALLEATIPGSIAFTVAVDPGESHVVGHADELQQVLINLCTNARQAMATTGGELTVSLETFAPSSDPEARTRPLGGRGYVALAVSDTGPGISPEDLPRLWEPFHSTKPDGAGLGLYVVRRTVTTHGGEISVESEPGRGAVFRVYLPTTERRVDPPSSPQVRATPGSGRLP